MEMSFVLFLLFFAQVLLKLKAIIKIFSAFTKNTL